MKKLLIYASLGLVPLACAAGIARLNDRERSNRAVMIANVVPLTDLERETLALAAERRRRGDGLPRTKGNLLRIEQLYRHSDEIKPDPFVRLSLAKVLLADGRSDEARPLYRDFLERLRTGRIWMASNNPRAMIEMAREAAKLGLTEESERIIAGFADGPVHQIDARFRIPEFDRNPTHIRANGLFAAAIGSLRVHREEDAIGTLSEVVGLRPDWAWGYFVLAYAQERLGRGVEAEPIYERAARLGVARPAGMSPARSRPETARESDR